MSTLEISTPGLPDFRGTSGVLDQQLVSLRMPEHTGRPAMLRALTRRRLLIGGGATVIVLAVLVSWLAWPDRDPAPRERQYKATTACLLTDDKDLTGDRPGAPGAGLQNASVASLIKVQHLAITGPQNAANGLTYYNTLGVQHCTVIV